MKFLIAVMLFMSAKAFATDGGSVSNGGGVICINGKCKTLVEAGLEIKPEYSGVWLPESSLIASVREIISNIPIIDPEEKLTLSVLGRLDQFRRVTVVDPKKLEAIKDQYIKLATDAGFTIDPATFEIVAFSSDNTIRPAMTYILPKFFELNRKQQADILLHEGLYRGRPTNHLKYVLQLEYAMSHFDECSPTYKINAHIAAYHLGILSKAELLGHILPAVGNYKQNGWCVDVPDRVSPFELGDVIFSDDKQTATLTFNRMSLLHLGEEDSRIPYIFSKIDRFDFKITETSNWDSDFDTYLYLENGILKLFYGDSYHRKFYRAEITDPESLQLMLPD